MSEPLGFLKGLKDKTWLHSLNGGLSACLGRIYFPIFCGCSTENGKSKDAVSAAADLFFHIIDEAG